MNDDVQPSPTPTQARIAAIFGPLEGAEVAGGCDLCDAFQTVEPIIAGAWQITVHHDDWCPVLARVEGLGL